MKQITIKNFHSYEVQKHQEDDGKDMQIWGLNEMEASDGSHTFDELYEHRYALWIALCEMRANVMDANESPYFEDVWRSKNHSDGEPAFGGEWFLLGVGKAKGEQITYHLPMSKWEETEFAETLDKAPDFDGHTSADVLERIKAL